MTVPDSDAETILTIQKFVDDRVDRYAKVLAGIVAAVAAVAAFGFWAVLELTQAKAIIVAEKAAKTVSTTEVSNHLATDMVFRKAVIAGMKLAPPGLIAAYHPAGIDGSGCPDGWSPFSEANGKFILGANRASGYASGDIGGSETAQLTTDHIPGHKHAVKDPGHSHGAFSVEMKNPGRDKDTQGYPLKGHYRFRSTDRGSPRVPANDAAIDASALEKSMTGVTVSSKGPGESFSTMPPYIALIVCRKD